MKLSTLRTRFFSPFGEIISGGATSRFDYEGKEFDSVVGDYDFHARKVNPQWGIFTQPDTMLPNVYDPQQLNRYAFERNNPYNRIDPDGHIAAIIVYGLILVMLLGSEWDILVDIPWEAIVRPLIELYQMNKKETPNKPTQLEPAIIHEASPADKANTQEKSTTVQEPKYPKKPDENIENLDYLKKKGLEFKSLIEEKNFLDKKIEEIKSVPGGRSASSGGGGRTSSQIAQEEVQKAEEQGGSGEYHEDPNGGATWNTITPRKKG